MDLEIIRAQMDATGSRQADLARLMGLTRQQMSKVMAGRRRLTARESLILHEFFGLAPGSATAPRAPGPGPAPDRERERTIPLYGAVSAGGWSRRRGAGPGPAAGPLAGDPPASVTCIDPALPRNAFALLVDGDSMDRIAAPGTRLYVDPDDKALRDGKYYIVRNEAGETTFKQFLTHPDRLAPRSTNPAHQPILLGEAPVEIIGRVLMWVTWG